MAGALTLSMALVACGSGSGSKSETAAPSTTVPTAAQMQGRLLGASDVGPGWQLGQSINPEDLSSLGHSIPCGEDKIDPAVANRLTAVAGVQFEPTDHSSKHLIELLITGESGQLDADLRALIDAMDSCAAATSTTTATSKLTIKNLSIPKLGDQQAAYVMTDTESADSTALWYVRNAVVRTGPVAVAVGLTEILPSAQDKPQISDETFVKILRAAVDKAGG